MKGNWKSDRYGMSDHELRTAREVSWQSCGIWRRRGENALAAAHRYDAYYFEQEMRDRGMRFESHEMDRR